MIPGTLGRVLSHKAHLKRPLLARLVQHRPYWGWKPSKLGSKQTKSFQVLFDCLFQLYGCTPKFVYLSILCKERTILTSIPIGTKVAYSLKKKGKKKPRMCGTYLYFKITWFNETSYVLCGEYLPCITWKFKPRIRENCSYVCALVNVSPHI